MSDFEAKKRDWFLTEATYDELADWFPETFADKEVDEIIYGNDKEHAEGLSWSRCFEHLEYLILRYSAGREVESLHAPCKEMFEEFARHKKMFPEWSLKYWEPDAYQYLMWLLGLAYLFNLPEFVPQIATWYAHNTESPQDDKLICTLFSRLGCHEFSNPADWLMNDKPYEHLYLALQAGDSRKGEAQKHLESYLKAWYKGMKDCYWYNRHKGKFATHFGYWSFESGLVSLLCQLDDSSYRDMLYYPKDLVDYARAHPFEPVAADSPLTVLTAYPGDPCPESGEWYSVNWGGRRQMMDKGDPMPGPKHSSTGAVIWHLKK